jgi:DNA-binding GntR family transcriptional regulator
LDRALKPVDRPPALAEKVYHALRDFLRNGAIAAGEPLQEVPLSERLGVSRTPVREAMTRLASEGLLASDGRSFTVPALTLADVDDIYELRFLIEPAAMRRVAARTADPDLRTRIEAALADAVAAHRIGDSVAFGEANVRYRAAWLALVPNRRLVRTIELYADHMQHIRALTLDHSRVRSIVLRGLHRITAALIAGDSALAAAAVHEHLVQARQAFIKAIGLDGAQAAHAPARARRAPVPRAARAKTLERRGRK